MHTLAADSNDVPVTTVLQLRQLSTHMLHIISSAPHSKTPFSSPLPLTTRLSVATVMHICTQVLRIPIFQMEKLRPREVKPPTPSSSRVGLTPHYPLPAP